MLSSPAAATIAHRFLNLVSEPESERQRPVLTGGRFRTGGLSDRSGLRGYFRSHHIVISRLDVELQPLSDRQPDAAAHVEAEIPAPARSHYRFDRIRTA